MKRDRAEHRDCILPPPPKGLAKLFKRYRVDLIPKPQPPSPAWRTIEQSAVDTVAPPKSKNMKYEVRDMHSDRKTGVVEADNYIAAAIAAASRFFGFSTARRKSGWSGHPGEFTAFNLDDETKSAAMWLRKL